MVCPTHAAGLNGFWSTNISACDKIFVKKGVRLSISKDSDFYGDGLVIDKNAISTKTATCNIKHAKTNGQITHMDTVCTTETTFLDIKFVFQMIDDNAILRVNSELPELNVQYGRCFTKQTPSALNSISR